MKIILIESLLISIVTFLCQGLHLQTQPAPYDSQVYLQSLQTIQDKLKSDLQNIESTFKSLDAAIQNATTDPNQQLRLYQEGIADERDSLYQIEQYLSLPFNFRSCQCFNFSDAMRQNFSIQLSNVQQQLAALESESQQCANCDMSLEIQKQIKIEQGYLKTMNDTVNARCCQIYQVVYIDNLTAGNWMNGGWTPEQYQAWMGQQVQNAIAANAPNSTLVRSCPLPTPYTNSNLTYCSQCQDQTMFFNIKSRQCEQCPPSTIFNYLTHNCDFNVACPPGSQFNQTTMMCDKIYPVLNGSSCPPDSPIWNAQLLACFRCNSTTPYYNAYAGICTTCPVNTTFNPSTQQCQNSNCQPGQTFNAATQLCESPSNTTTEGSSSSCPPNQPYWDKASLSCAQCPTSMPFFNATSKNCEVCPGSTTYNPTLAQCTMLCPTGQQLNSTTLACENITSVQPPGSLNSLCPPDTPIWNSVSKSCTRCAADQPYWNANTGSCQLCPLNQIYNASTNSCQTQNVPMSCSAGTMFNPISGNCEPQSGSVAYCPPDKPYYDPQILGCAECPPAQPYYNSTINQCQTATPNITCPSDMVFDPTTQLCTQPSSNTTLVECPPATPLWNSINFTCSPCPIGTSWNISSQMCMPCPDPTACGVAVPQNTTCSYNYQWSYVTNSCQKCQIYQKYNNSTNQCDNFCQIGEVYNSNLDICSGTISNCPVGLVFDVNQLLCYCGEGPNYKYYPQLNQCQLYCTSGQQFNYLTQVCTSSS